MHRLLLLTCFLVCCWIVSADLTLEVLDPSFAYPAGARCLDGSPASFHFEQGSETKKWVLYMQGGGSCDNEQDCLSRANDTLGSSNNQPGSIQMKNLASNNPVVNPGFWNWTHVQFDYCSGDRWAGTRVNASADSWGLYFAGHFNFKAILEHLIIKYRLDQATDILFYGTSAGAIGAMNNIDYLNMRLPTPKISLCMNGGWGVDFYPAWSGPGVGGEVDTITTLYKGHVNADCAAANPTNLTMCIFPRYVFAYIPNRVFIVNSLIDLVQMATLGFQETNVTSPGGDTYLVSLGEYTKLSILTEYTRDPRVDGLFITTCPYHVQTNNVVQGVLPNVAAGKWYYRPKNASTPAVNYDNCAIDSVVALLKANITLFDDCQALMKFCVKNNGSSSGAFEAAFNGAIDTESSPDSSPASVENVPTSPEGDKAATSTGTLNISATRPKKIPSTNIVATKQI